MDSSRKSKQLKVALITGGNTSVVYWCCHVNSWDVAIGVGRFGDTTVLPQLPRCYCTVFACTVGRGPFDVACRCCNLCGRWWR